VGPQPAYRRIRSDLLGLIQTGKFPPGSPLPSETQLAKRYGVTRMTVRQAVSELVRQRLVERRQGSGTYVLPSHLHDRRLRRLNSFTEDMRAQGYEVATRILAQEDVLAPSEIAAQLELGPGAHVVRVARVRFVDGSPVTLQESWIPSGRCPTLAREPLVDGSLYKTLETRHGITLRRADTRITAVSASKEQAALLNVPVHSPLLHAARRTHDANNTPVEYVQSFTNPEYPFSVELER
jgi:GntR family transcriptional regulator